MQPVREDRRGVSETTFDGTSISETGFWNVALREFVRNKAQVRLKLANERNLTRIESVYAAGLNANCQMQCGR
jgi:hypothetical protein